jgi:peptidoglycan/LPS O-acetylase OafA/YrhL
MIEAGEIYLGNRRDISFDHNGSFTVKTSFLPEVESLRGLLAFSVVVEHSYLYMWGPDANWFSNHDGIYPWLHWLLHVVFNGRAAVLLFFVISGFVLARQLEKMSGIITRRFSSFFVRRVFRIMPAMWIAVFVAFLAAYFLKASAELGMPLLLKNLFFQDWTLDVPLWSLNVEMGCCLLFPFLMIANHMANRTLKILLLLPLAALIFIPHVFFFLRFLVFFQIGILVGTFGAAALNSTKPSHTYLIFCVSCLIYGLSPQLWAFNNTYFSYFDDRYYLLLEIPVCFFILSFIVYAQSKHSHGFLMLPTVRFLGKISFSLYVLHYVVVDNLWVHFGQFQFLTFLWPYPLLFQTTFFLIIVIVSIPTATIVYHYVEVPFNRLGRRIGRRIIGADREARVVN